MGQRRRGVAPGNAEESLSGVSGSLQVRIGGKPVESAGEPASAIDEELEEAAEEESVAEVAATPKKAPKTPRKEEPKSTSEADGARFKTPTKKKDERAEVMDELNAAIRSEESMAYELPSIDMLLESEPFAYEEQEKDVRRKAKILEKTFANFGFNVKVVEIETGPVIAQFEVELEAGSAAVARSPAWPTTWRSPCACRASASWRRFPARTRSASKCPTPSGRLVRMREVIEEANGKAAEDADPDLPGQRRRRQSDGRRPGHACRTC